MPINFANIIERANARKDALEAFACRMREAPEQAQKLSEALAFFVHLKNDISFLDKEAQEMVKPQLEAAAPVVDVALNATHHLHYVSAGYSQSTLAKFLSACEELK